MTMIQFDLDLLYKYSLILLAIVKQFCTFYNMYAKKLPFIDNNKQRSMLSTDHRIL